MEMWRSLRDRPALRGPWTEAGTPRGQPGGLPTGCPHPCPPAARPSPHFHCWRPCGRDRRHHFDFFQPLSGAAAPARFACPLPLPNRDRRGSRRSRGNPVGVPQGGRRGGRKAGQGGGTPPPLGGSDYPPLGGFWRGRGSRPKGGGTPSGGAPRSASSRRSYRYKEANFWRKPRILFIINGLRSIFGFSYVHPRVNIYVHPRSEHSALWRT